MLLVELQRRKTYPFPEGNGRLFDTGCEFIFHFVLRLSHI